MNVSGRRELCFLDVEATGWGSNSYPTELGWAVARDDGTVESGSCLIRPISKWTAYSNAWSPIAERLTGITREMLDRDGVSPREAMTRFLAAAGDRVIYSADPDFDSHWLGMVADAAGISIEGRRICDAKKLIGGLREAELPADLSPPRHRAETDARGLALNYVHRLGGAGFSA